MSGRACSHPFIVSPQSCGSLGPSAIVQVRLRPGDFVIAVFTLANTVSGRTTDVRWFEGVMQHVEAAGAEAHAFVDAALLGCVVASDVLDLRSDAPRAQVERVLSSSIGHVQSGFKDYGPSPRDSSHRAGRATGSAVTADWPLPPLPSPH